MLAAFSAPYFSIRNRAQTSPSPRISKKYSHNLSQSEKEGADEDSDEEGKTEGG